MDKEVKAEWIAALRSRNYTQTRGALHDSIGFCCLGVLCDIHRKHHIGFEWGPNPWGQHENLMYLGTSVQLPTEVQIWAGLDKSLGAIVTAPREFNGNKHDRRYSLAELNDGYFSFDEIADIIEKQL